MDGPTIRDGLRRRKRWVLILLFGAWLVFAFTIIPTAGEPPILAIVPGIAFFGAMIFLGFFIRCPRCRGNLGVLNAGFSKVVPFYTVINYCPYCGVSLDAPAGP
jgi:hypothetical protein